MLFIKPPGLDSDLSVLKSAIGQIDVSKYKNVILAGDFNINISNPLSPPDMGIVSLMEGFGLHQVVTDSTWISEMSRSTIDHIYTSDLSMTLARCISRT